MRRKKTFEVVYAMTGCTGFGKEKTETVIADGEKDAESKVKAKFGPGCKVLRISQTGAQG